MNQKIKKFLSLNLSKKKTIVVLIFFLILGLFLPFQQASAQLPWIAELALKFATATWGMLIQMAIYLSYLLFRLSGIIFNWVISPSFISFKFTDNYFVNAGWKITRDLANIGFIIALAVIGLATALRIGEYQAKKTLPILILIALLINFTPVITGLIIDAGNIVMNFFLSELSGARGFVSVLDEEYSQLGKLFAANVYLSPGGAVNFVFRSLVILFFFLGAAFIFFLLSLLFAARYVALWILVILSPLAFFCYILPATRKIFQGWWQQFLQWTILGAIVGFFVYLADQLLIVLVGVDKKLQLGPVPPDQVLATSPAGFLDQILPLTIPLTLLALGVLFSISTAPAGASHIIKWATGPKPRTWGRKWIWQKGIVQPARTARKAIGRRIAEARKPALKTARIKGAKVQLMEKEKLELMKDEELRTIAQSRATTRTARLRRAGALDILAERGKLTEKERKAFLLSQPYGVAAEKVLKKMPHWAADLVKPKPGELPADYAKRQSSAIQERVTKMEPEEFRKNVQPEVFQSKEALNVFYAMDMGQVIEIGEKGKRLQKEALKRLIIAKGPDIMAKITALQATGRPEDAKAAKRIEDTLIHIYNSPNYT